MDKPLINNITSVDLITGFLTQTLKEIDSDSFPEPAMERYISRTAERVYQTMHDEGIMLSSEGPHKAEGYRTRITPRILSAMWQKALELIEMEIKEDNSTEPLLRAFRKKYHSFLKEHYKLSDELDVEQTEEFKPKIH